MVVESEKKDYTLYNKRHIYRYVSVKSQIIVSIDALDFDDPKIKIRFQKYDRNAIEGSRVSEEVSFYIPLATSLRFCNDILKGVYYSRKQKNPASQTKAPYFERYGGRENKDGSVISTHLTLIDDMYKKASFAFAAYAGPGEKDAGTGAILSKKGTKPATSIYIVVPDDDIKEMALIMEAYCKAFIQTDIEDRLSTIRKSRNRRDDYGGD